SVIPPALRDKSDSTACVHHTKEIFAVIIKRESGVPWSGCFGQLPAQQPRSIWHMPISFPLSNQPLGRAKIAPKRSRNELCLRWSMSKVRPWTRKKHPTIPCLHCLHCLHLVRNLVWGKQVVCIQPLNIITAT